MNLFEICNRTTPHLVGFKHLEHLFEALSVKCKPETQSPIKIFVFLKPFFFAKLVKSVRWFEILLLSPSKSSSRDNLKYNAVIFSSYNLLFDFFDYFNLLFSFREQPKTMFTILLYYICLACPSL